MNGGGRNTDEGRKKGVECGGERINCSHLTIVRQSFVRSISRE